jgi:hypothetical protein
MQKIEKVASCFVCLLEFFVWVGTWGASLVGFLRVILEITFVFFLNLFQVYVNLKITIGSKLNDDQF